MTTPPISFDIQHALMLSAIIDNNVTRANRLLLNGFDVNHIKSDEPGNRERENCSSLLNLLIIEGDRPQMAKLLIDFGIDFEHKNADGNTPLTHAIIAGHTKTVEVLLDSGAHPDNPGVGGLLPLNFAMQTMGEKGAQLTRILLDGGASSKHFKKQMGEPALEFCVKLRQIDCIKVLLAHGEDANEINHFTRKSPFMLAHSLQEEYNNGINKPAGLSIRNVNDLNGIADLLKSWTDAKAARDAIESVFVHKTTVSP